MANKIAEQPLVDLDGGPTPAETFELLRDELYQMAKRLMTRERESHTLQPTALLGEVWIKVFADGDALEGLDRDRLIARSTLAMQHILTDHARKRGAEKRGGGFRRVHLDDVLDRCAEQGLDALELGDALGELAKVHPRPAQAITLRFITGFRIGEIAAQLDVTPETVRTDLQLARAWLRRKLGGER